MSNSLTQQLLPTVQRSRGPMRPLWFTSWGISLRHGFAGTIQLDPIVNEGLWSDNAVPPKVDDTILEIARTTSWEMDRLEES